MTTSPLSKQLQTDFARRRQLGNAILDAEHALEAARGKYLQATGWTYTSSNNPGCWWLWEKETDKGKITLKTVDAVQQQQSIDLLDSVHDEEGESDDE